MQYRGAWRRRKCKGLAPQVAGCSALLILYYLWCVGRVPGDQPEQRRRLATATETATATGTAQHDSTPAAAGGRAGGETQSERGASARAARFPAPRTCLVEDALAAEVCAAHLAPHCGRGPAGTSGRWGLLCRLLSRLGAGMAGRLHTWWTPGRVGERWRWCPQKTARREGSRERVTASQGPVAPCLNPPVGRRSDEQSSTMLSEDGPFLRSTC